MKDLYTFDYDDKTAISTYYDICNQYRAIFEELRIPYILVCVTLAYRSPSPRANLSRLKQTMAIWVVACHMSFTTLHPVGKM